MGKKRWLDKDVDFLREKYPYSANALEFISSELQRSIKSITRKAESIGLKRDRLNIKLGYSLNEDYFDEWSSSMAYIVGFTLADGNIAAECNRITFCLNTKDIELLEFIASELELTKQILNSKIYDERYNKTYDRSVLAFSSKKVKKRLKEIGIEERKTGKEYLPAVPDKYFYDFLRGLFDGDGTVNEIAFSITSASLTLLSQICDKTRMGKVRSTKTENGNTQYSWYLYKRELRREMFKRIYKNGKGLKRKYERFKMALLG